MFPKGYMKMGLVCY